MKILFDQGVPVPLRRHLHPNSVDTASELGWSLLTNGDLIDRAEKQGYNILVTTDQNLRYQQNLSHRTINIAVLMTTSWPRIKDAVIQVQKAITSLMETGQYIEIDI